MALYRYFGEWANKIRTRKIVSQQISLGQKD